MTRGPLPRAGYGIRTFLTQVAAGEACFLTEVISAFNPGAHLAITIDGLDRLLGMVRQGLGSRILTGLPVVGDALGRAALFIDEFRTGANGLIQRLRAMPNQALQTVRETLFTALTQPGVFNVLRDNTGDGRVTLDDVRITTSADHVEFNLRLGRNSQVGSRIRFDIGLPAFGMKVNETENDNVRAQLDWNFNLQFGVSRSQGFYFVTPRAAGDPGPAHRRHERHAARPECGRPAGVPAGDHPRQRHELRRQFRRPRDRPQQRRQADVQRDHFRGL